MELHPTLNRRNFLTSSALLAGTALAGGIFPARAGETTAPVAKFRLRYAPHPGMFKANAGDNVINQIKFCADQGFTAFEYNGLPDEPPATPIHFSPQSI